MRVCIKCCLATVVAAAVLGMPQELEAAPIETPSPNISEPSKHQVSDDKQTPVTPSAAVTEVAETPIKENRDKSDLDPTSDDKSNIPRISVAANPADLNPHHSKPVRTSEEDNNSQAKNKEAEGSEGSVIIHEVQHKESKEVPVSEVGNPAASDTTEERKMGNKPEVTESLLDSTLHSKTSDSTDTDKKGVEAESKAESVQLHKDILVKNDKESNKDAIAQISLSTKSAPKHTLESASSPAKSDKGLTNEEIAETSQNRNVEQGAATNGASESLKAIGQQAATPSPPQLAESHEETIPQINVAVENMIKPVAPSPLGLPQDTPPAAKRDLLTLFSTEVSTSGGVKDPMTQTNDAVLKMIKPASTPETPKVQSASKIELPIAEAARLLKNENTENVTPSASSGTSETLVKQSTSSLLHNHPAEGNKELTSKRFLPDLASDQPLTTVITPVHAVQSEGGKTPSANNNQNINMSPVSGSPVNFVGEVVPSEFEPSQNKKTNAYTITPNEFAKKTAVAHAQKSEDENKETDSPVPESISDNHNSPSKTTEHKPQMEHATSTVTNNEHNASLNQDKVQPNNNNELDTVIDKISEGNAKEPKKITTVSVEKEKLLTSTTDNNSLNLLNLSKLTNKINNDLKAISDEVDLKWKERKEKISWLGEAAEVLHTYFGKITDTEKFSNKCTADDRTKYQDRTARLKEVINKCEATLKREDWLKLRTKTSEKVEEINAIVRDAEEKINKIPKEDQHLSEKELVIENEAKRKLQELNAESVKKTLSELKEKALQTDEEDYKKCIDSKEMEEKGNSIISETRTDIMKIYECV